MRGMCVALVKDMTFQNQAILFLVAFLSTSLTWAQPKCGSLFSVLRPAPTYSFIDVATKFPKLLNTIEDVGQYLRVDPAISHLRDLPFQRSNPYRGTPESTMIERAGQLDPEMHKVMITAYNSLNDKSFLTRYLKDLFAETVEMMFAKGHPADLKALERGFVTERAIGLVVVRRLKEAGDDTFTTLTGSRLSHGKAKVNEQEVGRLNGQFREAIRTGPFFDRQFSEKDPWNHGPFSHLIQRDIVQRAFKEKLRSEQPEFWAFLGTKKGVGWWVDIFDSGGGLSFSRPESMNRYLHQNLIGSP